MNVGIRTSQDATLTDSPRVIATTHFVRIDAKDEEHAKYLEKALRNDGFRVARGVHRVVSDDGGKTFRMERELARDE